MNLFQLLDGIFEGVVYFVYNVLRSAALLLLRPRRSPLRLFKAHLHSAKRQISSQTALLLASLGFSWSVSASESGVFATTNLRLADMASLPEINADRFWPYLLSAVLITVAIDVVLRTVFLLRFPHNRIRRLLVLSVAEYALCSVLILASAVRFFVVFSVIVTSTLPGWFFPLCTFVLVVAVPSYLAIAAAHIARGLRRSAPMASRLARAGTLVASFAGVFALLMGSLVVGRVVPAEINSARKASGDRRELEAISVMCRKISTTTLEAALVVRNRGRQPVVVTADAFDLVLGISGLAEGQAFFNYVTDVTGFGGVPGRSTLQPIVIEPDDSATISGLVRHSPHLYFDLCAARLNGHSTMLKRQYHSAAEGKDIEFGFVEPVPVSGALGSDPGQVGARPATTELLVVPRPEDSRASASERLP